MDITNTRWSEKKFFQERTEVLNMWPTGKDANLEEAIEYHHSMPASKNAALKALEAKKRGVTYLCPSSGTDTIEGHRELLLYLQNEGEADFLTSYIDSLSRNGHFDSALKGLKEAVNCGKAVLNGFPVVLHGVSGNREVIDAVDLPVLLFGPTPNARLVHEIGLAGGHSGYSGGPLISFWNYTKDIAMGKIIQNFQYVHRLMGYYEERGIPILYCVSGAMPAISPPSIMVAPEIIEVLIAAEQGVKHIQLNGWLQGNLSQDIANILTLKKLTGEYLHKFGYRDVQTTTFSVCPTGRFPADHSRVFGLISYFTMIGMVTGVQVVGSRTIDEAYHIPTKEGTASSFKCVKTLVNMLQPQHFGLLDNKTIEVETQIMEKEVRAILDKVIDMGDGDVVVGTQRAVEAGVLDQPYATSQLVKSKVMGVKDAEGAARFFDSGDLPFDNEIIDFHKNKIAEREKQLGKRVGYETVVKDLTAMSRGALLPD